MAYFPRRDRRARGGHARHYFTGRLEAGSKENARFGVGSIQQHRSLNQISTLEQPHRYSCCSMRIPALDLSQCTNVSSKLPQRTLAVNFPESLIFFATAMLARDGAACSRSILTVLRLKVFKRVTQQLCS